MTVIELIMHLRKSVSDKGMDIAVADGNGNIIPLNEKNLLIGCCGQWCKVVEENEDDEECDDYECDKDKIEEWAYLDDLLPERKEETNGGR